MKSHLTIKVYGKVQGVFFRQSAWEKAEKLGVCGFARNEPDGSVYLEAEGEKTAVEEFKKWSEQGPENAEVTKLAAEEGKIEGYSFFEIRK